MANDKFTEIYLNSLNLIKQDKDQDQKLDNECGDVTSSDEIISDDVDEQAEVEDEVQTDADEADDSSEEDSTEQDEEEKEATCFCFKTTNQNLIDAINSGFEEVTFLVKSTDGEGQDTTTEIKFTSDDFEDFEECECDDQENEEQTDDLSLDEDEFGDLEDGEGNNDSDDEDTTFESVFHKYYNSLISEGNEEEVSDEEVCPECGKKPCECEEKEVQTECGDACPECGKKDCTCQAVEEKEDKITKKTVKSAQEVQKLIEKDFGKKSKPWDLKQVKKVAFKNGKLFAASNDGKKWFNKQNKPIEL